MNKTTNTTISTQLSHMPTSRLKPLLLTLLMILCIFALASCGSSDDSAEDKTVSEGTETKCEVTGYHDQAAENASMFLKKGDKIAVISPSALPTEEQKDATIEGLKKWGYVPVEGKYVCVKERTLKNCLEDLEWALTDPQTKAIFCVRGGYGSSQVMDIMPKGLIKKSKKMIIGFSDITVYHSAWGVSGLPGIHSSMSATFMDLPKECAKVEKKMLKGEVPAYKCEGSKYDKPGKAQGMLIGGNLSTYTSVINTAYDCSKTDRPYILFLEEVESNYENVHRYLTNLKHAGVLDRASGIIVGEMAYMKTESDTNSGNSRGGEFKSFYDMISREFMNDLDVPVAYGFPAGHGERNYPLLMNEQVRLDVGGSGKDFTLQWK